MASVSGFGSNTAPMSRRQVLRLAGGLGLAASGLGLLEACGPATGQGLETTSIRIALAGSPVALCVAPEFVAEDILRNAGFTTVQYVKSQSPRLVPDDLAANVADLAMYFAAPNLLYVDTAKPIVMLAGIHIGCFVLFGSPAITRIGDLKGKTLAVSQLGGDYVLMSSILANVGIDPIKDVSWTNLPPAQSKQMFIDGQIDAYLAFPPNVQELRDKQIGHVMVDTMMDTPWAQYYCCMVTANRDFVQKNPLATKAALRAILQATDICATQPQVAAKLMVDKGYTTNYQYALEAMQQIPYNRWRVYDPNDTLRFYALLLRGVGMIKNTPDQLIQAGTDWRFLNELKTEMPATPAPAGLAETRNLFCAVNRDTTAGQGRTHSED